MIILKIRVSLVLTLIGILVTFCDNASNEVKTPGTILQSPNYPEEYDNNTDCVVKIRLEAGEIVSLEFLSFHIQQDWSCSLDFLEIRDGDSHNSKLRARICTSAAPITSTGNKMYIRFHTNGEGTRKGFQIKVGAGI